MLGRILFTATSHVLAALLLLVAASYWLDKAVWNVRASTLLLVGLFAVAYLGSAVLLAFMEPRKRGARFLQIGLAGAAAFGIASMGVLFAEWRWPDTFGDNFPPGYAFFALGLGIAILMLVDWAQSWSNRKLAWVMPAILLMAFAGAQLQLGDRETAAPSTEVTYLDTSLHLVKATRHGQDFGDYARGGAIAAMDDGYLIAAGGGTMHFVTEGEEPETLDVMELPYRVPVNHEEFAQAGRQAFGDTWTDHYHRERLRIGDLVVQEQPEDSVSIFVSHHYWKTGDDCYSVRVSVLEGELAEVLGDDAGLKWRTLYESEPCIKFNSGGHRGAWFGGYQIGGAMAMLDDDSLLLAVGDHEFDGWNRSPALPQDEASPYGKLMLVDTTTGKSEIYSLGHRNPQGLYVDAAGAVWSTEHGPRGGDELNLITQGANYGWPLVTYGTEYWLRHWPLSETAGRHDGFEEPALAFVPSIALSSLTGISGELFSAWGGDLLLVSLSGELARVRVKDGHPVVVEPITVGGRIRDVAQGRDGRLALWTDGHDVILLEPADEHSPQALVLMCAGCHTFNRRESASIGPNLWQIVGRQVGADDGFRYSNAMLDYGGHWTEERLDAFLADPAGVVPGTSMQFDGIKDAADRERLIDFLSELR